MQIRNAAPDPWPLPEIELIVQRHKQAGRERPRRPRERARVERAVGGVARPQRRRGVEEPPQPSDRARVLLRLLRLAQGFRRGGHEGLELPGVDETTGGGADAERGEGGADASGAQ